LGTPIITEQNYYIEFIYYCIILKYYLTHYRINNIVICKISYTIAIMK